ncbi:unnamed protein product [Urochloa humidicola]
MPPAAATSTPGVFCPSRSPQRGVVSLPASAPPVAHRSSSVHQVLGSVLQLNVCVLKVEDSYQPAKEHLAVINQSKCIFVLFYFRAATREITGATIENNVYCVSLHYRNVASQDMPRIQQVVDNVLDEMKDAIKLTFGHKVYEFRPPVDWNKGHAVLYLLRELGLQDSFPIYIGDDVTDEDAFEVIRKRNTGVGILVSEQSRKTSAFFSLKDPSQVMEFLHLLVSWKEAANRFDV